MSDSRIPWGYLYETTNLVNGKLYIGIHQGDVFDSNYLGSGIHIKRAVKKYGKGVFKARRLAWARSKAELSGMEQQAIAAYREAYGLDQLYNISTGGYSGDQGNRKGCQLSDWHKFQVSLAGLGRPKSAETREKLRIASTGRKHTKESSLKMSASRMGNTNCVGRVLSAETRAKISRSHLGKAVSESHKNKNRIAMLKFRAAERLDNHLSNISDIQKLTFAGLI